MELRDKTFIAEQYIRLGMGVYKSLIAAECTADEVEALTEENSDFMKRAAFLQAKEIASLLEDVHTAKDINIPRGISLEARWLLSKLDVERFGEGLKLNGVSDKKKFSITFAVDNTETDNDNVEIYNEAPNDSAGPDEDKPLSASTTTDTTAVPAP
jgi:hypothetical protein